MNKIKLLLRTMAAVAVLAVPLAAQAQPAPYPDGYGAYPGYPYATTMYPGAYAYPSKAWARAVAGTPLDPWATTVRVVPPKGGAVLLYRDGAVRGWWLQPALLTVRPGQMYGLVATRGTAVLFNAAMVFQPGFTDIVWGSGSTPHVAFRPVLYPSPYGHPGYGQANRVASRPAPAHGAASAHQSNAQPAAQAGAPVPQSKKLSRADLRRVMVRIDSSSTKRKAVKRGAIARRARFALAQAK